jgi:hypothetical protein
VCVSACSPACSGDTPACCDGVCTDVRDDANHCGACGLQCGGDFPVCCGTRCWGCFNGEGEPTPVCCNPQTQEPFCC